MCVCVLGRGAAKTKARGCGLVLKENKELSKALGGRAGQSANLENGKGVSEGDGGCGRLRGCSCVQDISVTLC